MSENDEFYHYIEGEEGSMYHKKINANWRAMLVYDPYRNLEAEVCVKESKDGSYTLEILASQAE